MESKLQQVDSLKQEAAELNRIAALPSAAKNSISPQLAAAPVISQHSSPDHSGSPAQPRSTAPDSQATLSRATSQQLQPSPRLQQRPASRNKGLQSSLQLEPGLANHWYPVAFSSRLLKDESFEVSLRRKYHSSMSDLAVSDYTLRHFPCFRRSSDFEPGDYD